MLASKGHAFAIHEIFTGLRGAFRILLNTNAFLNKFDNSTKVNLVVIMEKLYDDPCALTIVLQ